MPVFKTGALNHSDTQLWHVSGADSDTRIRVVRDMVLESGPGAGSADRNQTKTNRGKCQVEI